jgi:hypothetical protein
MMHFSLVAVDFVVPQLILKLFHSDFFQAAAIGTVGVLSALGTDFQVVLVTIVERFLIFLLFFGSLSHTIGAKSFHSQAFLILEFSRQQLFVHTVGVLSALGMDFQAV